MIQLAKATMENIFLKQTIKDELYKGFMTDQDLIIANERLKKENKQLRIKVKALKEIIKDDK